MRLLSMELNKKEKILLSRIGIVIVAAVLLVSLTVHIYTQNAGGNYGLPLESPAFDGVDSSSDTSGSLDESEAAYEYVDITFGGTCTIASMLGVEGYGTISSVFYERGAGYFLQDLSHIFKEDDLTIVGLNGVISDSEDLNKADKEEKAWYRAPSKAIAILTEGGVDSVAIECERTHDYGPEGYEDTKANVQNSGMLWGDSSHIIYKKHHTNVKSAVYCARFDGSNSEEIISWVTDNAKYYDFVALYITDDAKDDDPSEAKKALFRSCIDAGADIVVGTNAHNIQPIEEYGDGLIVYSLGTLIDGGTKYPTEYSALLKIQLRSVNGEITEWKYEVVSVKNYDTERPWHPTVASSDVK